jgi:hypothetical protein
MRREKLKGMKIRNKAVHSNRTPQPWVWFTP